MGLFLLRNFAVIDENKGLYRSAQPEYSYEYKWLKDTAQIDKIINLRKESNHDQFFAPTFGIQVSDYKVPDHEVPTLEQAKNFIDEIKASVKNNQKVLIHCEHGHGRTSTFCVLARIATGWDLKEAITEEENKFHYSFQHEVQKEFLLNNFKI